MNLDLKDKQGGKTFGKLKAQQETNLDAINQEYLDDESYKEVEDLAQRLVSYKKQFIEFDLDNSGDIDFMELKQMLEKIGQPKTHLECKKMIKEVNKSDTGTINYREFLDMMLGSKNSVLRLILLFEEKAKKEKESKVKGPPPKRSIEELLNSGQKQ
jgi:allograft inflammatory factor 1